jgi:cytoskeletal protein CcmA (bactofilin family)
MKFKKETSDEVTSILAEGTEMTGEITFSQGLRVDGLVRGQIRSEACLDIGPDGRVEAEVRIRRVSISGEFRGVIHASDRVEIHKEGKVYGDIFTPCLIIEAGALFEGKCNMSEKDLAATAQAAPAEVEAPKDTSETPTSH